MAGAVLNASLVALLGVVTITDLRTRLIPDGALLAGLLVAISVCIASDPGSVPGRALAALCGGGFLLAAALARPDGMGLGDVKLAAVLGFYLGTGVIEAMIVSFAAGSIAGLALLVRHGWKARSRTIPFAPFLALGALVTIAPQP
jgi:prepilin signal peptidase PulO-like enzyme (type II secretory pathway)